MGDPEVDEKETGCGRGLLCELSFLLNTTHTVSGFQTSSFSFLPL